MSKQVIRLLSESGDRFKAFREYGERDGDFEISREEDWMKIAERFVEGAKTSGLMSMDTECLRRPEAIRQSKRTLLDLTAQGMDIVWVIGTSGRGVTVRFDITKLRNQLYGDRNREGKHFVKILPEAFVDLLTDRSVLKVGSGILDDLKHDFLPLHFEMYPVLEIQWLMSEAKSLV